MRIPWTNYASALAQAAPLVAAVVWRRPRTISRKWILGWCLFLIVISAGALTLALQNRNNHWLNYLATPIATGMALWALSLWQASSLAFLWFRLTIPLLGIAWIAMVLLLEDTATFSLLAEPFAGLLLLGGAIYTLVSRAFSESGKLLKQDWFWIAAGLALYSGSAVALPPAARILLLKAPELMDKAYQLKSLLDILAFLAIARGVTCPTPAPQSGGSSWQVFSRWLSSSRASSSRS